MPASSAQRAATAHRRRQAVTMRLAGVDFETIAERLGYASKRAAHTDIRRAMAADAAERRTDIDLLRHELTLKLERAQAALWPAVLKGDPKAVETARRIIDQIAKLHGAYAPAKHEVITMGAIEAEIARLTAVLGDDDGDGAGEVVPTGRAARRPVDGPETRAAG